MKMKELILRIRNPSAFEMEINNLNEVLKDIEFCDEDAQAIFQIELDLIELYKRGLM